MCSFPAETACLIGKSGKQNALSEGNGKANSTTLRLEYQKMTNRIVVAKTCSYTAQKTDSKHIP